MTCLKCGGRLSNRPEVLASGEFRGTKVELRLQNVSQCDDCSESYFSAAQVERISEAAIRAHCRAENILSAEQIKAARRALSMSQQEFADHLGVGIASVKRWEAGAVPEKALSELIRLKTDPAFGAAQVAAVDALLRETLRSSAETSEVHGVPYVCDYEQATIGWFSGELAGMKELSGACQFAASQKRLRQRALGYVFYCSSIDPAGLVEYESGLNFANLFAASASVAGGHRPGKQKRKQTREGAAA